MDYLEVYDRYICKSLIAGFADFQTDFGRKSANLQNSGWLFIIKKKIQKNQTPLLLFDRFKFPHNTIATAAPTARPAKFFFDRRNRDASSEKPQLQSTRAHVSSRVDRKSTPASAPRHEPVRLRQLF